jgi:hypothetical protein
MPNRINDKRLQEMSSPLPSITATEEFAGIGHLTPLIHLESLELLECSGITEAVHQQFPFARIT